MATVAIVILTIVVILLARKVWAMEKTLLGYFGGWDKSGKT
jgi:hypothetical protein